jgi:predicted P-loop ATPase
MRTNDENPVESLSEPQKGDIFDMDVLRYELAQRNINMRYNNMTQELVIDGLPDYVDPDRAIEYIITELYGDMRRKYKYASLSIIGTLVNALAVDMRIQYHPVLEYFKDKHWDGTDHLGRLYETLGIENDELSQILVRKWFMQGWALLYNDPKKPYGADGVLTFAGPQGIGKTSFFKVMSINDADWFGEGQSITSDKDTRMRALSVWICELGEIGCTFKSDMDDLKNFITAPKDRYRRHYAASDTKALRRTNLGGTVNGTEFLIDQTGNRRFWTVPLGDKNIAPLLYDETITNPTQIWLQVWEQYCEGEDLHTCFRLTDEQQKMLAERNGKCEKPIEGEEQIKAIFDDALSFDWMTLRDWMNRHDLRGQIREKNVRAILDKFGATVQDKKIDGKSKSVRWLPR